jgi:hypothetical protein
MTKKEPSTQPDTKMQLPELYTNATLCNFSPYEFEITLGIRSSQYKGVRPLANIRMSPQFAKEFAETLLENIKMYEQNIGTLPELDKSKTEKLN